MAETSTKSAKEHKSQWVRKRMRDPLIVLVASLIAAYYFTGGRLFDSWEMFLVSTSWSLIIWYTQSAGNGMLVDWLDTRISWLEQPRKRAIVGFLTLIAYSFVAFQIVQLTFGYFFFGWEREGFWVSEVFWEDFWNSGRIAVGISFTIAFVLTAVGFFRGWRTAAVKAERLEKEVYAQRYEALRNQLNPHFLFNSLNVLTELIYEDKEQAVGFVRKMSDVYRYVLDSRERELVPLDEEIAFCHQYIDLLKERFGDNLNVHWEVEENLHEQYILPMALQLLIENAVKHNAASIAQPLDITITATDSQLIVHNALQPKRTNEHSNKIGLTYLKNRYASLGQGEITVDHNTEEGYFEVRLPYLKIDNNV
jgi:energy-coupling factor transporter transmembrane protein EcfT